MLITKEQSVRQFILVVNSKNLIDRWLLFIFLIKDIGVKCPTKYKKC